MRFALDLPNFGDFADVRLIAEVAAAAEKSGWDGLFIWDHIARSSASPAGRPTADVTVALTAIALATERIAFGTLVTPLARRRPQKVAREFVTLDQVSRGRAVLGIGLGSPAVDEFAAFGEDPDARVRSEVLDESLEVITGLWEGERVDLDGKHLRVHTEPFAPRPVQRPRIPIWVAASWPGKERPVRRAAGWDGIVPISAGWAAGKYLQASDIADIRERIGRDDFEVVVQAPAGADAREYERAGATWWIVVATDRDAALARARRVPGGGS